MNDEIISKSNVGSSIPSADEDVINVDGASRLVTPWITSKGLTNSEEDTYSRNVQNFTTFRASGLPTIARRDLSMSEDGKMLNHRRESPQQRYVRQSSAPKTDQNEEIESASSRFENAVIKYQKSKPHPRRQISRERQQQQRQSNYSSSDESIARNKSKSTSSIDTQSVNNILDEYEDLDYRKSSDLSDVGNISVTNFEAIMMDQQKRQQVKSKQIKSLPGAKIQTKSIPREKIQPVLKVNQQTQVRQRSRDRQKDSNKGHQQDTCCVAPSVIMDTIDSNRSKMPELLLRKGEVQKRVDEWLNQAHSQNFPVTPREKPLTRSNSSAEQKSQRRYRGQDSRSRSSIDEARDRLNGGTSSSYDDLTRVNRRLERGRPEKVNVGVNTSRGTYKEYLAARSKQQDYGFNAQTTSSRSGDINPISRIPQRGPLGSSFKSKRVEVDLEEKTTATSRIMNLTKAISESDHSRAVNSNSRVIEVSTSTTSMATMTTTTTTTTSSIISCRRLKHSGNSVNENCAVAVHSLVKEEMDLSCEPGPSKGLSLPGGSLSDQGEPISPNKDGESRRPAVTASGPTLRPAVVDKTIEAACKSMEVSTRCAANHPRGISSRIAASAESDRVVAVESPRRRLQFCSDIRRESRSIDHSRQEPPIYGSAVSARVRALQGQVEPRTPRSRCHQVTGAPMEVRRPLVLPRKDLGASPSRDAGSQDRMKMSIGVPSSSFKPSNRAYIANSDSQQQPNEPNAIRSKIAVCENVPSVRITRYTSPDHVEKIYERSLQPQVIHADNLKSILRPSLQTSPYGEKVISNLDRETVVKETSSTFEDETFEKLGKSRHEQLETIEEDDRKSEDSVYRYPEIGLKQCLKVQKSLPNGRSRESAEKKKDNPIYVRWNQQQAVLNEPAKTFTTFQTASSCQSNIKSNLGSPEIKEARDHEEVRRDPDESTTILQDLVGGYENASREDQDQLTVHSRENSNLSTATIPVDELESQGGSRLKTEENLSRNKLQFDEKLQDRVVEGTMKNVDERGAVVNEILVKNLQFEQDLPENPVEQTRSDYMVQQVNFHNILCDDYENEKLNNKKLYMTKEEMEHRRLIDMLKRGNFETLKMVSNTS